MVLSSVSHRSFKNLSFLSVIFCSRSTRVQEIDDDETVPFDAVLQTDVIISGELAARLR